MIAFQLQSDGLLGASGYVRADFAGGTLTHHDLEYGKIRGSINGKE